MPKTIRSSRLDLHVTPDEKELIERAATLNGTSTTSFIRSTMLGAAREVVWEDEVIKLTTEGSRAFVEALVNPPEPNENLRRLAQESKLARPE